VNIGDCFGGVKTGGFGWTGVDTTGGLVGTTGGRDKGG